MKKKIYLLLIPLIICFVSCYKNNKASLKPNIIVTLSPYNVWVQDIVGDTADVTVAIPSQYNPHVYEATPKDMLKFKDATLWLSIGDPIEKKLIKTLSLHYKNFENIDISQSLPSSILITDDHTHSSSDMIDRHFWLSPSLALSQCLTIKNILCDKYPQHQNLYSKNFEKLEKKFKNLIAYLNDSLKELQGSAFIISHSALGYFAQEFHLIQIPIEYEGKSPKPQDLQKIRSFSEQHLVLCAFTLEKFDNKGAIAVARSMNIPVYPFDPQNPDYFQSLETLAHQLLISNLKSS